MLHDQMINFLETAVVFLLLINAASAIAAAYAISFAQKARPAMAVVRRPNRSMSVVPSRDR
jgi:hypothetical protein